MVLLLLTGALAQPVTAATRRVPSEFAAIQEAIDAADAGDTIIVAAGTYGGNITWENKDLLIQGAGEGLSIIDGGGVSRGIYTSGLTAASTLERFTITNGYHEDGGAGMLNSHSNLTVTDCTFSYNTIPHTGSNGGGGMHNEYSNPTVTGCTFSDNVGAPGGGMLNTESSPTVTGCNFTENTNGIVIQFGGGMCNQMNSSPIVTNCIFSGNKSEFGAGMADFGGDTDSKVTNCTFIDNTARAAGGGMYIYGDPTVANCTFIDNTDGGGMHINGNPTVVNCTFSGNTDHLAGGIYNHSGSPTVANCILWGNSPVEVSGSTTINYSCVLGGWPGTGNIAGDPLFVDPANGDLRLLPSSPCIDAGDNSATVGISEDLDGYPRFIDDPITPDTGSGAPPVVDMGAYEAMPDPARLIEQLIQDVIGLNLAGGISNSMDVKLDSALKAIDDVKANNDVAAINSLQAFINAVEAQRDKEIPEADADALIAAAQLIIDLLNAG
jgi:hypothetical protein